MPVQRDGAKEAFDLNERILELVVAGTITEREAFLLFVDPGVTSDGSETPWQGWHRVYPPLPVTGDIIAALRDRGHHLYAPASSPPSLSARRRAREAVRQQVEALRRRAQAQQNQQQNQ